MAQRSGAADSRSAENPAGGSPGARKAVEKAGAISKRSPGKPHESTARAMSALTATTVP